MVIELSERISGSVLLQVARGEIGRALGVDADEIAMPQDAAWLVAQGASFVTLTKRGDLRGCIGTLEAHRPLIDDVRSNARAAAFEDPRFFPLRREEFAEINLEVSLLSTPEPLAVETETEALERLRPHIDGVVLEYGWHRATFLPQVWGHLPTPRQFLQQLKRKAGLPADFWADNLLLSRYDVQKWQEPQRG